LSDLTDAIALAAKGASTGESRATIDFCAKALVKAPNNVPLLTILGQCLIDETRYQEALIVLEKVVSIVPDAPRVWGSITKCYAELAPYSHDLYENMRESARRSNEVDPDDCTGWMALSYGELQAANYTAAFDAAKEALKIEPESGGAKFNMAASFLYNHMWEEGWNCFDASLKARYTLGTPDYGLPLWEGQPGKVLLVGEQGMGDEIMLASMIPDLREHCEIVIDTQVPLEGLFGRSFDCEAHGTRHDRDAVWKREPPADYWAPFGSLGSYFRTRHESFPGTPYLKPDPERRIQYRALLDSFSDKPKIGIAWTGGVEKTNTERRSLDLGDILPILEYDAEWVSLQYKNLRGMPDYVHHWDRVAGGFDYDETAALIAELDLVISVTTTAIHCAGAVGTKTWCLVPEKPQWRYGGEGSQMVWYNSVELLRQRNGVWPIQEICQRLSAMGIEKCRDNSPKTKITILPQNNTPNWSPPLSRNAGLTRYLITGLARAA
jgi:hypothetical protein